MFTDRNTHVPTPLTRGPQQVDSAGPSEGYLVWFERRIDRRMEGNGLTFQVLERTRGRRTKLRRSWPQINKDVHLAQRLENTFINSSVKLTKNVHGWDVQCRTSAPNAWEARATRVTIEATENFMISDCLVEIFRELERLSKVFVLNGHSQVNQNLYDPVNVKISQAVGRSLVSLSLKRWAIIPPYSFTSHSLLGGTRPKARWSYQETGRRLRMRTTGSVYSVTYCAYTNNIIRSSLINSAWSMGVSLFRFVL